VHDREYEKVIGPRDEMVVKAMSWALRALATRDSNAAQRFVASNEAVSAKSTP